MVRTFKTRSDVEKQIFVALAKKLWQRPLSLAECFCVMSRESKKLRLHEMKGMLLEWQEKRLITISPSGYVELNFSPQFFIYAPTELITWIADESARYCFQNTPHGLKIKGDENERGD